MKEKVLILLLILAGLSYSQQCQNCAVNMCISNSFCLGCQQGFLPDNTGSCRLYTPIEGCQQYNVNNGQCFKCFPGHFLQFNRCTSLIENCNFTITNDTDLCTQCNSTYVLVNDINCYSGNVSSCGRGSLPRGGKAIYPVAFCQKFELQKCAQPDSTVKSCSNCLEGYFNLNGVCYRLLNQTACTSNQCQCQFYYFNNVCYQLDLQDCLKSNDKLFCDLCNDTLVAVNGRCFTPVKINDIHCNVLTLQRNICSGCNFQYYLDPNNICVKNFDFCLETQSTSVCEAQCKHSNLLFYEGKCYIRDPQCIAYDKVNNRCTKCFEGYSLNSNLQCQKIQKCWVYAANSQTRCQQCFTGYQLNENTFSCRQLPYNCLEMNSLNRCQRCVGNTSLLNQQTLAGEVFPSNLSIAVNISVCAYTTQFCKYYNTFGYCQICQSGYIQKNKICIPTASNCLLQKSDDKSKCLQCARGYQLDASTEKCYPTIEGCTKYASTSSSNTNDSQSTCLSCRSAYVLRNSMCFYRDTNCLQFKSNGNCLRCGNNLVPYYNRCVFYDAYCFLYDENGKCSMSMGGFSQNVAFNASMQQNYKAFIAFVRAMSSSGSSSSGSSGSSAELFYTSNSSGLSSSTSQSSSTSTGGSSTSGGSSSTSGGSSSKSGVSGGSSSSGSSSSSSSSSQTTTQTTTTTTITTVIINSQLTNQGGYYTAQGIIRSLPSTGLFNERILQYDVNGRIRLCRPGYSLIDSNCVLRTDNCEQYSGTNGRCVRCLPKYHMGQGRQCVAFNSNICPVPTISGNYCTRCSNLYALIEGQCYWKGLNVNQYDSANSSQIRTVQNGYFIYSQYQVAWPYDSNCANQQQPGKCLQCLQQSEFTQRGMRAVNGRCILVKDNCALYSERGLCSRCVSGYNLYFGQCFANNCLTSSITDGVCTSCPFLLQYEAGLCINKAQNNCLVYQAIINYTPAIRSVNCQYCLDGYYLRTDFNCQQMITNCQTTDQSTGRCLQCIEGYTVYQQQCIKLITNCQTYNRNTQYQTCDKCFSGFDLLNNGCFGLPFRCIELDSIGRCAKCSTGYEPKLQNGQSLCIFRVDNCLLYNTQGRCVTCNPNYVLQNNLCNFFILGCQRFIEIPPNTRICGQCLSGFFLRNGYCSRDPNCIQIINGACSKCIDGFRLEDGLCKKNTIDNCLVQVGQVCQQCANGYVKIVLFGVEYCVLRRIVYNGCQVEEYPCRQCATGYQLRNDGFCYAIRCRSQSSRFSLRTCTECYPYFNLDPTRSFCILYNCNNPACYGDIAPPPGFKQTNITAFLIYINYCVALNSDYSCRSCSDYRYPNLLIQWNLCYPSNCRSLTSYNCSGNCQLYYDNHIANDNSVCVADNCKTYNQNLGSCQTCIQPYQAINGICRYEGPCQQLNVTTGRCDICKDAYILSSGSCLPKNCTTYNPNEISRCLTCAVGFELTADNTCQLKYCTLAHQNYPCISCINGYFFNQATGLCHLYNCRSFNYLLNKCDQCQASFSLQNGLCVPNQCQTYNQTTFRCVNCVSGYRLTVQGLCVIDNCCYFNNALCTQCCAGFDFINGMCQARCLRFNTNNICLECRNGYKLNLNNQCVTEIDGCISYNGNKCVTCRSGLQLDITNGVCIPKFCSQYQLTNPTVCIICKPRYYRLNDSGLCYPRNCINFNTSQWSCLECERAALYSFQLISNESLCFTQHCSQYQQDNYICQQCQNTSIATSYQLQRLNQSEVCVLQCGQYYELINGSICRSKYCSQFFQNNRCSVCIDGYQLESSTGLCKLKYCSVFNGQLCRVCQNGFTLDPVSQRYCVPINCRNYDIGSDRCLQCADGYVKQFNYCVLKDCFRFDNIYTCQNCRQGFQLIRQTSGRLICQKIYSTNCQDGYYFSSRTGSCQPITIDFCRYINPSIINVCLSCLPGYYLYNGLCYSIAGCAPYEVSFITGCKSCIPGFRLQTNGKICTRDICAEYFTNGQCKSCISGYYLINGQCRDYTPNCINGDTVNGCTTCQSLYQPINGLCSKLPENCLRLISLNTCAACAQGYVLYQGLCYKAIANCINQNGPFCTRCQNLYSLSADSRSCLSKQPIRYCQTHDSSYEYCLQCQNGYQLTPQRKCLAQHCVKYDLQSHVCLQCGNGTKIIQGDIALPVYYQLQGQLCVQIDLPFCNIPFNATVCQQCMTGYELINGGICRAQFCSVYQQQQQQQCQQCINGYYLTASFICRKNPDNCLSANPQGICLTCAPSFTLIQTQCIRVVDFCVRYNPSTGQCLLCENNYYLTSNGVCNRLPANCVTANLFGVCLQCANDYLLHNTTSVCYKPIPNCFRYNSNGNCISCQDGYYLNSAALCLRLPDNCINADINGRCITCVQSYQLNTTTGLCVRSINNCIQYQGDTCLRCVNSYQLIGNLCYKIPQNCLIANVRELCDTCSPGYTLFNGLCYRTVDFCEEYFSTGLCSVCRNGYYVNSAGLCVTIPVNCNRVSPNGLCLQCANNFILQNGICFRNIQNCQIYNPQNFVCLQCINGFYLLDGLCKQLPSNCLSLNQQQQCLSCASGYTLQGGICYRVLSYCQLYNPINFLCSKCINGFYLVNNNVCVRLPEGCINMSNNDQNLCASCATGYQLQNGVCYKVSPNCQVYDPRNGQCQQCLPSYELVGGFCYQRPQNCATINSQRECVQCISGYSLQNGICYKTIAFCEVYSSNFKCFQCADTYYLNSEGFCTKLPPNCQQVSVNGRCTRCINGFFLPNNNTGICYKYDLNCLTYDDNSLLCATCNAGYYLSYQFVCIILPRFCAQSDRFGNCTQCLSGYTLNPNDQICYPQIPQCSVYDPSTLLCKTCLSGFFLRNGFCYRTIDNCLVYSPQNFNCLKCQDSYILSNNVCLTCGNGFYVRIDGTCEPNPRNCLTANQYGQCLRCNTGYSLDNGACISEIPFCQKYSTSNSQQQCVACYAGYYLKDPQNCFRLPNGCAAANSAGSCLRCHVGFTLNNNGTCYRVVQNCQSYQLATGICLQCVLNYYLTVNQTCIPIQSDNCQYANSLGNCLQCRQGYVLVNGKCFMQIPYCIRHGSTFYGCYECVTNYYVNQANNRECLKVPNGCAQVNVNSGLCTTCLQGYKLLSNGLCQLNDNQLCIRYELFSGRCLQCKFGYYLFGNDNRCQQLPSNCQSSNSEGRCLACITGFFLQNGLCYRNIVNCQTYIPNTGKCQSCISQYYLENNLCYRFPENCLNFDTNTNRCLQCAAGFQLQASGICLKSTNTNCLSYNPAGNQCYTCKNSYFEYWINQTTGAIIPSTALISVDTYCRPYPRYCSNVDLYGNCISCCFASRLSNGQCVGTVLRQINCDIFDPVNLVCLQCVTGYLYCQVLAICIEVNINCLSYNSFTNQCSNCVQGFILNNGRCIKRPPGQSITASSNGQIVCNSGYTYSGQLSQGSSTGGCYRNKNQLRKTSTMPTSSINYQYTSFSPGQPAQVAQRPSTTIWNPPAYLNNYMSITSNNGPQIIHYVEIQGTSNGYVTQYLLHFRNKENGPFICWNSCQPIQGNVNGNNVSELKLSQPIVASQVRIYPLKWVGGIWLSTELYVEVQ